MPFIITTLDMCVQGFERLRSRDEFILTAYPSPQDDPADVVAELKAGIDAVARADDFDYAGADSAIDAYFDDAGLAELKASLASLDAQTDDDDDEGDNPVILFLYLKAVSPDPEA